MRLNPYSADAQTALQWFDAWKSYSASAGAIPSYLFGLAFNTILASSPGFDSSCLYVSVLKMMQYALNVAPNDYFSPALMKAPTIAPIVQKILALDLTGQSNARLILDIDLILYLYNALKNLANS